MPRLVGQRSDSSSSIALVLIVLAAGVSLEYLGYVNVVPGFGRDMPDSSQENTEQAQ